MPILRDRVEPEAALDRVQELLGSRLQQARLNHGQVDVTCAPDDLVEVVRTIRDAEGLRCRFFTFLSTIDWSEYEGREGLELLVHLYSPDHVVHVNVRVPLDAAAPRCPSITGVFRGAQWHEREAHEMFWIDFEGHPNLANLYLPEDFEGHPLLKSFRLPSRVVKEWPGAKDPDEASAGGR